MRKFFALSFRGKSLKYVILETLLYAVILVVCRVLMSLVLGIASLPEAAGIAVNLVWQIVRLYCFAGVAVAILYATDCLVKKKED